MANYEVSDSPVFTEEVRKFEITDRAHADVFNTTVGPVFENTVANRKSIGKLENPEFSEAGTLAKLTSKESNATLLGKIAKGITDLISHLANTSNPHNVTASNVGLGNVPNVATNNQTPTYTAASSLTALSSGEKLSVAFGKIAKAVSDLISHLSSKSNPHEVTASQIGAAASSHSHSGYASSSHNQAASTITAGTLGGQVCANASAMATVGNAQVRDIYATTSDLTAGSTSLTSGKICLVYE